MSVCFLYYILYFLQASLSSPSTSASEQPKKKPNTSVKASVSPVCEVSEADSLVTTVASYFQKKLEKKSNPSDNVDEFARHMSNVIYEMLKGMPRQQQYRVSQEFFNIILKQQNSTDESV